jgi:hypothetical protein
MKVNFPSKIHLDSANFIVYPKQNFYTTHDIKFWTSADGTIWGTSFIKKNGKMLRRINAEELEQIIDHANNMNKLMQST